MSDKPARWTEPSPAERRAREQAYAKVCKRADLINRSDAPFHVVIVAVSAEDGFYRTEPLL